MPVVGWTRLGRARGAPGGMAVHDGESGRWLGERATVARSWRADQRRLGGVTRVPTCPSVVPALPDEHLKALGWEPVVAPGPEEDEATIRAYLGPPPTRDDIAALADMLDRDETEGYEHEAEADGGLFSGGPFGDAPFLEGLSAGIDEPGSPRRGERPQDPATQVGRDAHLGEGPGLPVVNAPGQVPPVANSPEQVRAAMGAGSGAEGLAHAAGAPGGAPWPLPGPGQLPIGVAPAAGGGVVDVGALARQHVDGQAMVALEQVETAGVDTYTLVEVLAAWDRIEAMAAYRKRMVAHQLATRPQAPARTGRRPATEAARPVAAAEIAFRLGTTRQQARGLIDAGAAMTTGAGMITAEALRAGVIDAAKADMLIERTNHLPAELALAVQEEVLTGGGPLRTLPQLRRAVDQTIARVDPEDFAARHRRARRARRVGAPQMLPDGMAATRITWPATDAMALHTALEAAARTARTSGDTRTLDHLRTDALATMAHSALAHGYLGPCPTCTTTDADTKDAGTDTDTEAADTDTDADGTPDANAGTDTDRTHTGGVTAHHCPVHHTDGNDTHATSTDAGSTAEGAGENQGHRPVPPGSQPGPPDTDPPDPPARTNTKPPDPQDADPPRPMAGTPPEPPEPEATDPPDPAKTGPPPPPDPTLASALEESEPPDPSAASAPGESEPPGPSAGEAAAGEQAPGCTCDQIRLRPLPLGTVGGAKAQIRITLPLSALMGTDHDTADLEGYGPIPADLARAYAAGGTWKRLVTDPLTQRPLEVTARQYKPPAWLREQILAATPYCIAPGCGVQSRHADIDHTIPFPHGPTAAWNLHPICRHHHLLKTDGYLTHHSPHPHVHEWTTPSGHTYRTDPAGTHLLDPHRTPIPWPTPPDPHPDHPTEDDPPPF